MRLILNWMLLCLLALALPLQGLAAVGARACQPDTATVVRSLAAVTHTGHTMHAMQGRYGTAPSAHGSHSAPSDQTLPAGQHIHADADADADASASASAGAHVSAHDHAHADGPSPTGHQAHDHHTCSSCASCCAGAALPVTVAVFATSTGPVALVPTQPATTSGWLPPQPQRPPRPDAL
jgi:hypothetical protein